MHNDVMHPDYPRVEIGLCFTPNDHDIPRDTACGSYVGCALQLGLGVEFHGDARCSISGRESYDVGHAQLYVSGKITVVPSRNTSHRPSS